MWMFRHTSIAVAAAMLLAFSLLLATGCDDDDPSGDGGPDDADTDSDANSDADTPTGEAALHFTVTWGSNPDQQFHGNVWQTILDLNVFNPQTEDVRDTRLVFMLCETADVSCEAPVLVREVTTEESDGDPIQASFGPEITLTDLPEGSYQFMIFADTGLSRSREHGWDSGFDTDETAWGGVVSELDVMLSDPAESGTTGVFPAPSPVAVELIDGETVELGTLELQHVHEQNRSPAPTSESGVMVVAVEGGLRFVDLQTQEVEAVSTDVYTQALTDADGTAFPGDVCGMVRGPEDTVFVLFHDSSEGGAGYAVQFDVGERSQPHLGNRVLLPGSSGALPCRGMYGENGGEGYLFVTNATSSRLHTADADAGEGFWAAPTAGLTSGDVTAAHFDQGSDDLYAEGIDDIAISGGTLYLSITGDVSSTHVPPECRGTHCVFVAPFDGTGTPDLTASGDYEFFIGPDVGESYPTAAGEVACVGAASPWAAITIAPFHDGRTLLFLGACLEIAVFDLADGSEIDFSEQTGIQGIDGTVFGSAFNSFALSPDGETLWALPAHSSMAHFYFQLGLDPERRQTFTRYMAFPIALSTGAEPALAAGYTGENLDDHEGLTDTGDTVTPAEDPGVDIDYGWYIRHQMYWLPSTNGETFGTAALPFGPSFTVTPTALWVRGSGDEGQSGLGKGGNLAVYDLATRRAILWPRDGADFYHYWAGGAGEDTGFFGFDLTPESDVDMPTRGLEYFSLSD